MTDNLNQEERITRYLHSFPEADIEEARKRVFERLRESLESGNWKYRRSRWWQVELRLPVPVAAGAVVAFGLLFALLFLPDGSNIADMASAPEEMDINVNVDAAHTAELLEWLNSQDVGSITIQLPENAEFSFQGEPVLMRPEEYMIEPLYQEEAEEE